MELPLISSDPNLAVRDPTTTRNNNESPDNAGIAGQHGEEDAFIADLQSNQTFRRMRGLVEFQVALLQPHLQGMIAEDEILATVYMFRSLH